MTNEEAITWGLHAESLIMDPNYNLLFDKVKADLAYEILSTPLDDAKYREQLYTTFNGMRAFADRLTAFAIAKKNIVDAMDAANDTIQEDD